MDKLQAYEAVMKSEGLDAEIKFLRHLAYVIETLRARLVVELLESSPPFDLPDECYNASGKLEMLNRLHELGVDWVEDSPMHLEGVDGKYVMHFLISEAEELVKNDRNDTMIEE